MSWRVVLGALAATLGLGACGSRAPVLQSPASVDATTTESGKTEPVAAKHPEAEARALYRDAEARFAQGDAVGAVGLLEAALAQTPGDADPQMRHALEARLTHMQLVAWTSTQDLELLLSARQRLFTRMRGFTQVVSSLNEAQADRMRDELFEQLSDVDAQLEAHLDQLDDDAVDDGDEEMAILAAAAEARPPAKRAASGNASPASDGVEGTKYRKVVVQTQRRSTLDDPAVRGRFNSSFASANGLVLTRGADMLHGPRGLVRVLRAEDSAGRGARARARAFVGAHREPLVACYDAGFGRDPILSLQLRVTLSLEGGAIRAAKLVRGSLIDAEGDRCLVDALLAQDGYPDTAGDAVTVDLLFFYEEPKFLDPQTGESYGGAGPSKAPPPDPVESQKFAPMPAY